MKRRYRITADDFVEANRAHRTRKPAGRALILFLTAIFSLMLVSSLVLLVRRPLGVAYAWYHPLIAAAFLFLLHSSFFLRRQFKRTTALQRELEAGIDEDGISISSESSNSRQSWDAFEQWHETRNLFLLYQQPALFNLFPKRAFAPGEADQFRELLRRKIPTK